MPKPIHESALAVCCALIALGGSAIGYAIKEGHAGGPSDVAACATVAQSRGGATPSGVLARAVRGCRTNDLEACARVAGRLETLLFGGDNRVASDRALAHDLAEAAVMVIRDRAQKEGSPVEASLARCSRDEHGECERIAATLAQLFTGADAQLDASRDRELARAFAKRLVAVADRDQPVAVVR